MLQLHRFSRLRHLRIAAIGWLGTVVALAVFLFNAVQNAEYLADFWPAGKRMPLEIWILFASLLWLAIVAFWPELDAVDQPDVALVCDWTEDQKKALGMVRLSELDKGIIVHNRSDRWIYNVQIDSVTLAEEMVFESIDAVGPDQEHPALARWGDNSSLSCKYSQFFAAPKNEQAADRKGWHFTKTHNRGMSPYFLKIPMILTYEAANRTWQSKWNFIFDIGFESLFEKRSQRRA